MRLGGIVVLAFVAGVGCAKGSLVDEVADAAWPEPGDPSGSPHGSGAGGAPIGMGGAGGAGAASGSGGTSGAVDSGTRPDAAPRADARPADARGAQDAPRAADASPPDAPRPADGPRADAPRPADARQLPDGFPNVPDGFLPSFCSTSAQCPAGQCCWGTPGPGLACIPGQDILGACIPSTGGG